MQMPSPGAVCPAMVNEIILDALNFRPSIVPDTRNTTIAWAFRFDRCSLKLPGPD